MARMGPASAALLLFTATSAGAASRASFEDLVANLKSPNLATRQDAASALGKSRRREAVAPLAALVRDPEPKVRLEVVKALGELRDQDGVPALVTSVADGDPRIREEAIGALVQVLADSERTGPVGRFLELFSDQQDRAPSAAYAHVDPAVPRALATALKDEESEVREAAALSLGILDGKSEVKALTASLQDPVAAVRGKAATAIGQVGSVEDGRALIPLLSDENAGVRNRVLQALGVLRVREAGPALRQLYEQNRKKDLGLRTLSCLSRIGDPAQADLFRELLQDPDVERRRLAVEGLGRVGDTSILPSFKKDYQREHNDELRLAYSFSMTVLGDKAFLDSVVLCLPSKTLGNRCRNYVLEMGRDVLPELYPYLNDPDAEVRAQLCDILTELGDPDAIAHLTPLIADPSAKVADHANRAVERLRAGQKPNL
jgi:HEAT repeat protein